LSHIAFAGKHIACGIGITQPYASLQEEFLHIIKGEADAGYNAVIRSPAYILLPVGIGILHKTAHDLGSDFCTKEWSWSLIHPRIDTDSQTDRIPIHYKLAEIWIIIKAILSD